ncbi:MAG: site-specific integrase [Candidatus Aenigmarchaeota archaeon]|nr:site-specific integrase [Candidatus Aenigmarchaeota archaeon]
MEDLRSFKSVDRMMGELKLLTRSANTEKTYLKGLRQFFRHLGVENPDELVENMKSGRRDANETYRDFVVKLASSNLAPKSVAAWSASLKKFLSANGIEVTKKVPIKVYNIHEDSLPTREELRRVYEAGNIKAKVCIAMMSSGGLRIGELHQLKMGDVNLDKDPATIRVRAAGAKERKGRITFVTGEAKKILEEYIATRKSKGPDAPLISTDDERSMTYQNLQFILNNAMRKFSAKEGKRFKMHPHSLRKWFKTQLIAAGVPGPIVDRLTGHARYLAQEYELYTEDQLREWYSKGANSLQIM